MCRNSTYTTIRCVNVYNNEIRAIANDDPKRNQNEHIPANGVLESMVAESSRVICFMKLSL